MRANLGFGRSPGSSHWVLTPWRLACRGTAKPCHSTALQVGSLLVSARQPRIPSSLIILRRHLVNCYKTLGSLTTFPRAQFLPWFDKTPLKMSTYSALAETWALYVVGSVTIFLRCFCRWRMVGFRGLEPDDYIIMVSWVRHFPGLLKYL